MKFVMKLVAVLLIVFSLTACRASQGNLAEAHLSCTKGDQTFVLSLPGGSGRELPDGIVTGPDHPCGQFRTGPMIQGEDRSPEIEALIKDYIDR